MKWPNPLMANADEDPGLLGKTKLYVIPDSTEVVSAQLMLEYKRVPYKQVALPPGVHAFIMLTLGFKGITVPALAIDGRRVQGSRWIARALDELVRDPPLFPVDPQRRRHVEDLERWGEQFHDAAQRLFYCTARRHPSADGSVAHRRVVRGIARVAGPQILRLAASVCDASEFAGREALAMLPERLGQIDAWIAQGSLNGEALNAADLQIAPNIARLLHSQDLWPYVEGRPAAALARRVVPCASGPGRRLVPPEWIIPDVAAGPQRREPPTQTPRG
jgi:glutathione S-transferase